MEQSPSWETNTIFPHLVKIFTHLIEPDSSSPCAQEPTTCPLSWARTIQSTPSHSITSGSMWILFRTYAWIFPLVPFLLVSSSKTQYAFCYPTHVLRAQYISFLITGIVFDEEYRSRSSSLCSSLQSPIVSTLFCPNIFLSTSFSNTLSPRYCLYMTDHISYSCQITGKIIFPCILIVICLGIKRKGKRFIHEATWHNEGS